MSVYSICICVCVCVCVLGYWSLSVYGRKHCYKLFTRHFNEAVHWACAIQKVIDSKPPLETPTQTLIRDIEVRLHTHTHTNRRVELERVEGEFHLDE